MNNSLFINNKLSYGLINSKGKWIYLSVVAVLRENIKILFFHIPYSNKFFNIKEKIEDHI